MVREVLKIMKKNKYDDETFFEKYKNMPRSVYGLDAAGEWQILKNIVKIWI